MGNWCRSVRRRTVLVLRHRKLGNCRQQGKNNVEPQADFRTRFNTQRHRTLHESRFAAIEVAVARGGSRTLFSGGFFGPREKTSRTQSLQRIRTARSSVLRRTTLSKPVRGCNRFLTIEGSPLELCYIPYPCASTSSKCEIARSCGNRSLNHR